MKWASLLGTIVSATAAKAAYTGASSVAGPVVGAAADVAARTAVESMLGKFLEAEASMLQRLDDMNAEMRGRLSGLESGVDALLDQHYRTAQLHLKEAARRPERAVAELDAARSKLFDAWGSANTRMRRYLVAAHLAMVYALLGDAVAVREWLRTSHGEIRAEVEAQAKALEEELLMYLSAGKPFKGKRAPNYEFATVFLFPLTPDAKADERSAEALWQALSTASIHPVAVDADIDLLRTRSSLISSLAPPPGEPAARTGLVRHDDNLQGWLAGLVSLDTDSAVMRQICEQANVPPAEMPRERWDEGAVRISYRDAPSPPGFALRAEPPMLPAVVVGFRPSVAIALFGPWDQLINETHDPATGVYFSAWDREKRELKSRVKYFDISKLGLG